MQLNHDVDQAERLHWQQVRDLFYFALFSSTFFLYSFPFLLFAVVLLPSLSHSLLTLL